MSLLELSTAIFCQYLAKTLCCRNFSSLQALCSTHLHCTQNVEQLPDDSLVSDVTEIEVVLSLLQYSYASPFPIDVLHYQR